MIFFCDKNSGCNITEEELDDGPNASRINFSLFTYQVRCTTHNIIPNGPSVCRICEENDDINNGIIKRPIYGKKKHLAKM